MAWELRGNRGQARVWAWSEEGKKKDRAKDQVGKGEAEGPGGHGAGERFSSLAHPFAPPGSCKAALCPQPRPHTVCS